MRRTSVSRDHLLRPISGTEAEAAVSRFSGWTYPLVWAAFALLLLVCAGQLYRRRRMERDVYKRQGQRCLRAL